ncbi:hypothetical protein QET93_002195 [Akkermansia sp. N21116]|jgi:hypothetical protein|uniref:hypothetical protein n=1 Tax=Akkermansia sp. N21116 TaxID=3040764 RepID=UPI00244ECE22|nr:hypothetical protein [Akkermansia sp. N21116]WPX40914.1 hypothetical protein QET93_002195 [Akkermansia sp. N21116]
MKCVLISSPGEFLEGAAALHGAGYEILPYPSIRNTSCLTDAKEQESARYLGRNPASVERSHVRSLRASFIRMLRDHRFDDDDMVIFGESDAYPQIDNARLESALKQELASHLETDIFRLFFYFSSHPCAGVTEEEFPVFTPFQTKSRDPDCPYVWGTHAMVIPARSRERVARVFSHYRLPTDIALGAAAHFGELNIRVSRHNLFYQRQRTRSMSNRYISSCILFRMDKEEQTRNSLIRLLKQSYPGFHVAVSPEDPSDSFRLHLSSLFHKEIQQGCVSLISSQFHSRPSPFQWFLPKKSIEAFDLFIPVETSELPDPAYFRSIHEFHQLLPNGFSSYRGNSPSGGLLSPVLSRKVMMQLRRYTQTDQMDISAVMQRFGCCDRLPFDENNPSLTS